MELSAVIYVVDRFDGDYAYLKREDGTGEEKLVAIALLPEQIEEGTRLKYEMFSYEVLN